MKLPAWSILLCLIAPLATADAQDGLEVAFGKASEGIDVLRLAWRKPWSARWRVSATGELSGMHVMSLNRWQDADESINALAYSPVVVYRLHKAPITYVKFGIGVAYLSATQIKNRNLSSYFQFEDQIGIGWEWGAHDLSLVYMHYSNAGIEDPNHGIDIVMFSYARRI